MKLKTGTRNKIWASQDPKIILTFIKMTKNEKNNAKSTMDISSVIFSVIFFVH